MLINDLRIGIKYCGHCNPQREGQDIVQDLLRVLPGLRIVSTADSEFDAILVVNACPVGCASLPVSQMPWINIAVNQVRNWLIPKNHPANELLNVLFYLGYELVNTEHNAYD